MGALAASSFSFDLKTNHDFFYFTFKPMIQNAVVYEDCYAIYSVFSLNRPA